MVILSNNDMYYIKDARDIVEIIRKDSGCELASIVEDLIEERSLTDEYARYRAQTDSDSYEEELNEINYDHDRIHMIIIRRLSRLYEYSPNNKQARDEIQTLKTIKGILEGIM